MTRRTWLVGIALAVAVVVAAAMLASSAPDGLEHAAAELGFADRSVQSGPGPLSGYALPLLGDGVISTVAAGVIGVGLMFAVMLGLGRLIARRSRRTG